MRLKNHALALMPIVVIGLSLSVFLFSAGVALAAPTLILNEFKSNGSSEWIEIQNVTASDVNLSGWNFVSTPWIGPMPGAPTAYGLTGTVPAMGLLVIPFSSAMRDAGAMLDLGNNGVDDTSTVAYGDWGIPGPPLVSAPGSGESAIVSSTGGGPSWSVTTSPSVGWFNYTADSFSCSSPTPPGVGLPPSLSQIASCIFGITTNLDSLNDPTHATNLYFRTSTNGQIFYDGPLNLTDQNTRALMQAMGDSMNIEGGKIGLNASTSLAMKYATITIDFYGMNSAGYANIGTSSLIVKDDLGATVPTSSIDFPQIGNISWDPATNSGMFSFRSNHFSEYDINPTVVEITPVPTPSTNTSPQYTFATNVTGTAVFAGDCAMASTSTTNGNNTVTFGPLSVGTHSNCTVKVIDGLGASTTLSVTSFTINDPNPPGTITGLTATAISNSQINLAWTATSTATYYNIYGGTNSSSLPVIATTTSSTYNVTSGLTPNTLYYFKISGVNGNGEGASSTAASTSTLPTPPPNAPTGVTATATSTTAIVIGWVAPVTNTPEYYNVYGSADGAAYSLLSSTTSSTFSYIATGNGTNTRHYYKVSSVSGSGETTSTAADTYTFAAIPTAFISTASSTNSISLQWSDNGNPTSTTYYVNTGIISTSTTATTTVLSGLTPNTSYTINIIAINGAGVSSTAVTVQDWTKAANPTSLAAVPDATSVSLSWNGNSNPSTTTYRIYGAGFATSTVTTTSAVISGLTANTLYTFNVQSQNNDASFNSVVTTTTSTLPIPPPNAPTGVTATATSTTAIVIGWAPPATNTPEYYNVYGSTDGITYNFLASTTSSTSSYIATGNGTNTRHYYKVSSVSGSGETTSTAANTYTNAVQPNLLFTTASTSNSISLTWSANGNPAGTVYQISGPSATSTVLTSTSISGLSPNTSYTIYVQAQSGNGNLTSQAQVTDYTKAAAPTGLANTASTSNSLSFSWSSANPSGTIYRISGTGANFSPATTSATSIVISGLIAATTYTSIDVVAINNDGSWTASSSLASAGTQANEPTSLITTASTSNSIALQWSANGNASGTVYQISGGAATVTTTATTSNQTSLTPNTSYAFTVKARNPDGSFTTGITANDWTKASDPVSLVITTSTNSIGMQWGNNSNPAGTSYLVGGPSTTTVAATSTSVSGLTANTQYTVTVRSVNHDSSTNAGVLTATDYTTAAVPAGLTATATSATAIDVSWTNGGNPAGTVYQLTNETGASITSTVSTAYAVTGLTPGTTYQFKVRAKNIADANYSSFTATTSATTLNVPTVTTGASSNITTSSAEIAGNVTADGGSSVGARGAVYGTASGIYNATSTAAIGGTGAYSVSLSGLSASTTYYYRAYATNSAGTAYGSESSFKTSAYFTPTTGNPTSTIGSNNNTTNTIDVPLSVTNPTVDLSSITTANSSTLPGAIDANVVTSLGTINVDIPAGTVISSTASWTGTLNLPSVQLNSIITNAADTGYTATVSAVVEVGFGSTPLTLSNPARIFIPGMGGKLAGWSQGGTFHKITNTCASDSAGGFVANECKININGGADLVIWTNHFTYFVAYTQTQNSTNGGSTGSGYSAADYNYKAPTGGVAVKINNGSANTASKTVTLNLSGGTDAKNMAISNSSDFTNISQQGYASTLSWTLTEGNGTKTVYVKFYNQYGSPSAVVSASIILGGQATNQAGAPQAPANNVLATYTASAGDLVKSDGISSAHGEVYYIGADLKAYLFPTRGTYASWYPDFSALKHIRQVDAANISMGSNVTARAGANLVRFANSNAIYAVTPGAKLCSVANSAAAKALYGTAYAGRIIVLPSLLLDNYTIDPACKLTATSNLPDGSVFQYAGNSQNYLVQNGLKRAIAADGFNSNMFQQAKIIRSVPASMTFSDGPELSSREDAIATVKGQ